MITIQIATTADAVLIADMSRQTFYDTFAAQNTKENMDKFLREQFTREALIKEVGAPNNTFFIASLDGRPAGYARVREQNNPPELRKERAIEVARIYALNAAIGKGIGSALMQECIAFAKQRKADYVWLGVWQENLRAIEFYKRWGFEVFASHDFVLGDDVQKDWLMKKKL